MATTWIILPSHAKAAEKKWNRKYNVTRESIHFAACESRTLEELRSVSNQNGATASIKKLITSRILKDFSGVAAATPLVIHYDAPASANKKRKFTKGSRRMEASGGKPTAKVAVAMMTSSSDAEANFKVIEEFCRKCKKEGALLLCLPECFAFMGLGPKESIQFSQPLTGPLLTRYSALAKAHGLYISFGGFQEKAQEGKVYNTHVVVDPEGKRIATYRKIHLFDVEVPNGRTFKESSFTRPGEDVVVCKTPFGNLGVTICYDLRFPGLYSVLRAQNAQILLVPAAFAMKTGMDHWEVLLRARAIENQCYVLAAAQCGVHNSERYRTELKGKSPRESYGDACVIDPWGKVIARGSTGRPGLVFADLDLKFVEHLRQAMPVFQHKKPEIYPNSTTRSSI
mmetsp:Transcript_30953/g.75476  ORF Transcript_30953/g.75476 Transcript_30953/m.75476 type:complete len:398 (+) Transcript_30953:131-1324(+)